MTIAIGNKVFKGGSFSTGNPVTGSAVTTAASGSTFCFFCLGDFNPLTFTPADNKGNTYSLQGTQQNDSSNLVTSALYASVNGVGGANHIPNLSLSLSGVGCHFYFFEITGGVTSSIIEQFFGNVGFLGDPASGPVTTINPNQLIVSYFFDNAGNSVVVTPTGGFTNFATDDGTDAVMTRVVTAAGTYDPNPTFVPSGGASSIITASFIQSSGVVVPPTFVPSPSTQNIFMGSY